MTEQEKRALWKERVEAWQASGESLRAYAQRHGWTPRQLGWWKNRLSEKASAVAPMLIPVAVRPAVTSSSIRLTGAGWSLDLPAATSATWLADLLRAL